MSTTREMASAVGMTLLTVASLALTAVLMLFAAFSLPWWSAWVPVVSWAVGVVVLVRLMWQEWRDVWRR